VMARPRNKKFVMTHRRRGGSNDRVKDLGNCGGPPLTNDLGVGKFGVS